MTNKEYLGHMLRRATKLFGQNALSVQHIKRQLQEIKQKESSAEWDAEILAISRGLPDGTGAEAIEVVGAQGVSKPRGGHSPLQLERMRLQ